MAASLKAGDGGLGHLEPLTEFCLREVVVDEVGDHALRDRAGERGAVPLLAERRVFERVGQHIVVARQIGSLHDRSSSRSASLVTAAVVARSNPCLSTSASGPMAAIRAHHRGAGRTRARDCDPPVAVARAYARCLGWRWNGGTGALGRTLSASRPR